MKWTTVAVAGVLVASLTGVLFAADATPAAGSLRGKMLNRMAEKGGPAARLAAVGQRLGFILEYLNEFPDVKAAVKDHRVKIQALQGQLKTLRELVRAKMQDAKTPEEREAAIETARTDATTILAKVVDEAIAHQKTMADLAEKHQADIVKLAVDRVFERRARRLGARGAGEATPATTPAAPATTPAATTAAPATAN